MDDRPALADIRARCAQPVTEIVENPREYFRVQTILRDRAELLRRVDECVAALRELVALKDLHDKFDAMKQDVPDVATAIVLEGIGADYRRRKPAAWESARAILRDADSAGAGL